MPTNHRSALTTFRGLTAAAVLFGSVAVGLSSAAAQSDEDEGTYESPTFGYILEWDAETWTVEAEVAADENDGRDLLYLLDTDATTQFYVEGSEDSWSDADDCVATLFQELNVDPEDGEVVEDADGEPIETSDDNRAAAAYVFPPDANGTQDEEEPVDADLVVFGFCYADPDSDLVVGFSGRSILSDDWGTDGYDLVKPIMESLPFAGSDSGSSRDDDSTPEPDNRGGNTDDDETPEADTGGIVEDGLYVSPTYGFELAFDDATWSVTDAVSEDEVDMLLLTTSFESETGDELGAAVTVMGFNDAGGPAACLDGYIDILDSKGDGNAEYVLNADGEPLVNEIEPDQLYSAYYFFSQDGDQYASYVVCASLGGDDLLTIEFTSTPDGLADETAIELSDEILGGISF
ncbi:MAG TPA: hypothetical protein VGT61_10770 [Thermomicrobiales bacterium]|jgi:hypothetical protein|nr:hypothetical protein [Thermomicrobiales bacterium]